MSKHRLKVACLTSYQPAMTASVRYRVQQYEPYLNTQDIDVYYIPFAVPSLQKILYQQGKFTLKLIGMLHSLLQWLKHVNDNADLIIVQREAALIGPPWVEQWLARKKPLIFDFDDAIFLPPRLVRSNIWGRLSRPYTKTKQLIQSSQCVWAGNEYLAVYARKFNSNVLTVPTVVDCETLYPMPKPSQNSKCTLGWIGSHSTTNYLLKIVPVLEELAKKHHFQLLVVGANQTLSINNVECHNQQWHRETEAQDFQSLDIGLYPIDDNQWALGKCGLKAIQYGAVGIPCVASAVGVNTEIIDHERTGFLAQTPTEWFTALDSLLSDAALRSTVGTAARQRIKDYYSVERYQPLVAESIRGLVCAE